MQAKAVTSHIFQKEWNQKQVHTSHHFGEWTVYGIACAHLIIIPMTMFTVLSS